ncbi:hypothetical protein ABD83_03480 [Bacillus xiamenensis]|nr:hypothetical protein BA1_02345 [Bacillus xiamenensis]MBG9910549.1 hypothetical protein [Bacillus xiamenensis]
MKHDEIKVFHTPDFFLLFIRAPIYSKFNRKRNDANEHKNSIIHFPPFGFVKKDIEKKHSDDKKVKA